MIDDTIHFSYVGKRVHFIPYLITPISIFPKISISPPFICLVYIGILKIYVLGLIIVGTLSSASNKVLSLYQEAFSKVALSFILTPDKPSIPAQNIFSESNPQLFQRNGYN